jgi:hypothetical protein
MSERIKVNWVVLAVVVVAIAVLAGCAGKGKKESEIWAYAMPEGKTLVYTKSEDVTQEMEIMGQAMQMTFDKEMGFTMAPAGGEGTDLMAEVTITALTASMSSPQGDFDADGTPAIDKSFMMTFSSLGKEMDISGAEDIKFSQGPQGDRSLQSDFAAFLPDLPGMPVKVGDTWTSVDEIPVNEQGTQMTMTFENLNTFMGFETIGGMKCARIDAVITGTMTGTGEQMGAPLTFDGTTEGTETWYFAVEEGVYVKGRTKMLTTATVTVSGPQEMVIPMTMDMTVETNLEK